MYRFNSKFYIQTSKVYVYYKNKLHCETKNKVGVRMSKKIGDLTLRKAKELMNCCEHIGFIKGECFADCRYFDENKCDCKLSVLAVLEEIDLDQEIEVEE